MPEQPNPSLDAIRRLDADMQKYWELINNYRQLIQSGASLDKIGRLTLFVRSEDDSRRLKHHMDTHWHTPRWRANQLPWFCPVRGQYSPQLGTAPNAAYGTSLEVGSDVLDGIVQRLRRATEAWNETGYSSATPFRMREGDYARRIKDGTPLYDAVLAQNNCGPIKVIGASYQLPQHPVQGQGGGWDHHTTEIRRALVNGHHGQAFPPEIAAMLFPDPYDGKKHRIKHIVRLDQRWAKPHDGPNLICVFGQSWSGPFIYHLVAKDSENTDFVFAQDELDEAYKFIPHFQTLRSIRKTYVIRISPK